MQCNTKHHNIARHNKNTKHHNIAKHNKNTIHHNTEKQKADENKAQVDRGGEAGVE